MYTSAPEIFDTQKLKTMMDESSSLSVEDKQRLKVAFAEGYLAGHNIKAPGKSVSQLKSSLCILLRLSLNKQHVEWTCESNVLLGRTLLS